MDNAAMHIFWIFSLSILYVSPTSNPLGSANNTQCDFESRSICGFTQARGGADKFDWSWNSFGTGTSGTGPTDDHTLGTRNVHYMYIEASSPRRRGDKARLLSPIYNPTSQPSCLKFWYNMYGRTMGTLNVYTVIKGVYTKAWTRSGNQGKNWNITSINVPASSGTWQIVFEGIVGNGIWSDVAIDDFSVKPGACSAAECEFPVYPENGYVGEITNYTGNSTAELFCNDGYNLTGNGTIQCTENATWSSSAAFCNLIECEFPVYPENGYVGEITNYTVYSTAELFCNDGYNLTGNGTIQCTENATWSSTAAFCSLIECEFPVYPENGYVGEITNYTVYSTAELFCKDGYNLTGNGTIQCTENATWSSTAAFCSLIECPDPVSPKNGFVLLNSGKREYADIVTYSCYPGYELVGTAVSKCMNTGLWLNSAPTCHVKMCTYPVAPKNGRVNASAGLTVNSTAIFYCEMGYFLSGQATIQCTENKTWSYTSAICILIDCGPPNHVSNGRIDIINGTKYNEIVTIVCDQGYYLVGDDSIRCLLNGSWSVWNGNCSLANCNSLPEPVNGGLVQGNSTDINSTAEIYCNEGFRLNGSAFTQCLNGNWIPDPSIMCTWTECSYLVAPVHGSVITSGSIVNSTANFTCDNGYDMTGVPSIICLTNGNWSSQTPFCLPKECSRITYPDHGHLILSNKYWYQSIGRFTCDSGYTLVGSNATKCSSSANWTCPVPTCNPVDCGSWTYANNTWKNYSYITYTKNTIFGSTAIGLCRVGYHVLDGNMKSVAATCLANGTWSITSPPLCVQVGCPVLNISKDVIKVEYSDGSTRPVNSTATFSCKNTLYRINGFEKVTCLSTGEWTGSSPSCTKVLENISPCPASIDLHGTQWEETQPGRIKTKTCPVTENYVGEIFRHCTKEGNWLLPVYNCIRQDIAIVDQQIEAIMENPSEEVVTSALDKLNSITKPTEQNTIFGGEIDKVTSILESIADISGKIEVTDNQAEAFLDTTSNLLDTSNTETWKEIYQEPDNGDKQQGAKGASKVLDVVSRYSDAITASLSKSNATSKTVAASNLVLHVSKINNETDGVSFPEADKSKEFNLTSSFHLPKESLQGLKHVSSIMYKNLSGILPSRSVSNGSEDNKKEINSAVVAVKIENWEKNTRFQISLTLGHFQDTFSSRQCSFWNENVTAWDSEGCVLDSNASSSSKSACECNHLTNFAILMSPVTQTNVDSKAIDIISTIGCSISILALVITVLAHVVLWKNVKSDRVVILINLSVALVISYAVFLGGIDRTDNKETCTTIAALLQYIYLVVFFLMLAEGIEISVNVLYVFTTASRLKWLLPCAWLIPAVIVGISLGATRLKGYGNEQSCWLSVQGGLIWAFVVPAMIIIVVNFVLLVLILRAAFGSTSQLQKSKIEKTKSRLKCLCVLLPLMGCTWVIGIFYVNEEMAWIQYLFAICNSLQGLVIFIFHCAMNKQIHVAIKRKQKQYTDSRMMSTASENVRFSQSRVSTSSTSYLVSADDSFSRHEDMYNVDRGITGHGAITGQTNEHQLFRKI